MIILGAGTNHWFHSDTIYRTFLALITLTGCQGVNGGGWAHYVGQEKCRPVTGWAQLAFGLDWSRPPRQMIGTAFWYVQHRPVALRRASAPTRLASPLGEGRFAGTSDDRHARPVGALRLDAVLPAAQPQLRSTSPTRPRPRAGDPPTTSSSS